MVFADELLAVFGRWLLGGWKSKSKELGNKSQRLRDDWTALNEWILLGSLHTCQTSQDQRQIPLVSGENFPDILSLYSNG